jgi:hypothetical protein
MKNIIIIAVFSLFLIGCGASQMDPVAIKAQGDAEETIRIYAEPPLNINSKALNMRSQTAGAISVLRNDLDSKGFSLNDCSLVKAYISSIDQKPADRKGFLTAYKKVFGTRLVPNKPQIILIEVLGFSNPEHLVLLEAECHKSSQNQ